MILKFYGKSALANPNNRAYTVHYVQKTGYKRYSQFKNYICKIKYSIHVCKISSQRNSTML